MTTPKQIENLRNAYAIMAGIPKGRIDLDSVRKCEGTPYAGVARNPYLSDENMLQSCGSVACVAGWLSAHPKFKVQGLDYMPMAEVYDCTSTTWCGILERKSLELFGVDHIFDASTTGEFNDNQKRQALARIRRALFAAGAITEERDAQLQRYERRFK